ncbi:MAG: DUF4838 domain-containing protein [Lentisphaerae bacterium]|nr:DUF4838 domain-containing protein [Lentisphaerota bacterium]MBT5604855.1 DUF4838 domain-containing protein [Lentisphaerota bacterium]MBT7054226.1 DUF4838 domain-containing protein [Lentisphaerota bacterium]MBT7841023.1 DUF4838 domain-containing protein [Lentisphaerota bacterium]
MERSRQSTVFLGGLLVMLSAQPRLRAELTLVKAGKPTSVIVTNGRPSEHVMLAAIELQEHLRLVSGATVPIVKEDELGKGKQPVWILLGDSNRSRNLGFRPKELEAETFVVKTSEPGVILAGDDSGRKKAVRMGTLWAVYDFLQDQLGCRWLWPGETGRFVPRRKTVTIGAIDIRETPLIQRRHIRASNQAKHKAMYKESGVDRFLDLGDVYDRLAEEEATWARRMRLGTSIKLKYGHAFTDWWEKHKDTHRGVFALQPKGGRRPKKSKKPDFVKMCISSPELWEMQLAPIRKNAAKGAKGMWLNACENDGGGGFCVCARCRAWDANPNTALKALPPVEDGSEDATTGQADDRSAGLPECLSDRYARWYNELAVRLREIEPESNVICYAYTRYRAPPTLIDHIEPNVWVGYIGFNGYPRHEAYRKMSTEEWFGWSDKGATVFLRSNGLYYSGEGAPFVFARQIAEDTRFHVRNGMKATDYDCSQGLWAVSGPSYYVLARMLWDTGADVDQLLDEFYDGFGTLAPVVREYYTYWEDFTTALNTNPKFKDQRRVDRVRAYPALYSAEAFDKAYGILKKGRGLFRAAPESEQQRFKNILLGLKHGRLLVAALKEGQVSEGDAGKALMDFRREIAPRNVLNVYWTTYKEMKFHLF